MNQKKHYQRIKNIILKPEEKKDKFICLRQEQHIQGNGLVDSEMVLGYRFGQMEQGMKANGKTIELMAMGDLYTLTEMFMKEIGSMIKLMDLVYMSM